MKDISPWTYNTNYFQRLTLESWYINLQQTPLDRFSLRTGSQRGRKKIRQAWLSQRGWKKNSVSVTPQAKCTPSSPDRSQLVPPTLDNIRLSRPKPNRARLSRPKPSWEPVCRLDRCQHQRLTNDLSTTKTKPANGLLTVKHYQLTSTIHHLQRLSIHKKITPARLACICYEYVSKTWLLFFF